MEEQGTIVFLKRSYLKIIPLGFVGSIHEMLTTVEDKGTTWGGTTPCGGDSLVVTRISGLVVQS